MCRTWPASGGRAMRSSHGRDSLGRLAGEDEVGQRRGGVSEPLVGVEQRADVLARLERAEEQQVAVAGAPPPAAASPARRASRR